MPLQQANLGPFSKGVVDSANPSLDFRTSLKSAKGAMYSGGTKLSVRPGSALALTLKDDQGTPATVDSVCAIAQFTDFALAIGYSTSQSDVYLYRLSPTMDGWYNSAGVLQATASPEPVAVLWTGVTVAPDVLIAEGLGTAYIAHTGAAADAGLYFPTKTYEVSPATRSVTSITRAGATATATTAAAHALVTGDRVTVSGAGEAEYNITAVVTVTGTTTFTYTVGGAPATPATGTILYSAPVRKLQNAAGDDMYFSGVVSFQQHLWGWGYGAGSTVGTTSYRPELARFSGANFGAFAASDSITLGDRVRSVRERIVGGAVAGEALFLGAVGTLTRVTGFGRNSWSRAVISNHGFTGPKGMATAGDTLYYWSPRGPARVTAYGEVEPLWDAVSAAVATVSNPSRIVAGYDQGRDQVRFHYDSGSGVRTVCAYDVRRDAWVSDADDCGLAIRCAAVVEPVYASTATPPAGPSAAPTTPASTSSVGTSTATANWTNGDSSAETVIEYKAQSLSTYTVAATLAAGIVTYTFSGLSSGTAYHWRVRHLKNGQYSAYYGPAAATEFTTSGSGGGGGGGTLVAPTGCSIAQTGGSLEPNSLRVNWINSGESGVSTEVEMEENTSGTYTLVYTAAEGVSSYATTGVAGTTYRARVRHVKSGATSSSYSTSSTLAFT